MGSVIIAVVITLLVTAVVVYFVTTAYVIRNVLRRYRLDNHPNLKLHLQVREPILASVFSLYTFFRAEKHKHIKFYTFYAKNSSL